jgi:hypothetical protein
LGAAIVFGFGSIAAGLDQPTVSLLSNIVGIVLWLGDFAAGEIGLELQGCWISGRAT